MKPASKLILSIFTIIILISATSLLYAGTEVGNGLTIDGQIRERTEFTDNTLHPNGEMFERSYLRTRLALTYTGIENTKLFIQLQDSRILGTNSGGLNNDFTVGMHQAYIKFKCVELNDLWMQAGRFEVVYGRQRVLGSVGWSNTGRTFDGFRAGFMGENVKVDLFVLKINERYYVHLYDLYPFVEGDDQVLYGAYMKLLEDHLHLFGLYDYDHQDIMISADEKKPTLARFTFGGYYQRMMSSGADVKLDFAYQVGSNYGNGYEKIAAYMLAAVFGYFFDNEMKTRVAAGVDITSGNDPDTPDKLETYNNLYYTGHAFHGFMDFFLSGPSAGLMDIFARVSLKPTSDWTIKGDFHLFRTMEEYSISPNETSNAIGQEIDITIKRKLYDGLDAQLGASLFFATDDGLEDSEMGSWFYFMLTANIK